jgi:hypothetical protein
MFFVLFKGNASFLMRELKKLHESSADIDSLLAPHDVGYKNLALYVSVRQSLKVSRKLLVLKNTVTSRSIRNSQTSVLFLLMRNKGLSMMRVCSRDSGLRSCWGQQVTSHTTCCLL